MRDKRQKCENIILEGIEIKGIIYLTPMLQVYMPRYRGLVA